MSTCFVNSPALLQAEDSPPQDVLFYKVTSELCSGINTASVITPYGYRIVATGWGELNVTWLTSGITAERALIKPQDLSTSHRSAMNHTECSVMQGSAEAALRGL